MVKKIILFIILFIFIIFDINSNAYGFGLVNKKDIRPNIGKYEDILKIITQYILEKIKKNYI